MPALYRVSISLLGCLIPVLASAADTDRVSPAPLGLEWQANARLRHENVDDRAFAYDARATTLRLRAGALWRISPRLEANIESEAIGSVSDTYNSTSNRRTRYPVVADPDGIELNRASLRWHGAAGELQLGRQRIALDNQRWIGTSGWRQNEQTFDAAAGTVQPRDDLTVRLARLVRAHRVNGDKAVDPLARERRLQGDVLNVAWSGKAHRVTGYVYAIEDRDVPEASTRTVGLRYVLSTIAGIQPWGWTTELARQNDYGNSAAPFSHAYWLVEPALASGSMSWRLGWEHLGGNGAHALQTPLAALHALNGWADRFAVTPPSGLDDRYFVAAGAALGARRRGALEWNVAWHDYRADTDGSRLGRESNISLALPLNAQWRAMVKFADYRADGWSTDVRKWWLQLEWTMPARM